MVSGAAAFAAGRSRRAAAGRAVKRGFDRQATEAERPFLYFRSMHSQAHADQQRCGLCRAAADAGPLKNALPHADIIRRFGRLPYRNAVLGRVTTPQRQAFLDGSG
jgi:uncharacterized protein (DUF924 family)